MIFFTLNQKRSQGQKMLHQLVQIKWLSAENKQAMKKAFNSRQVIFSEILYLQRYIKANFDECHEFLKIVFSMKIHQQVNSEFLDAILILTYLISDLRIQQNFNCQDNKQMEEQSKLQNEMKSQDENASYVEDLQNNEDISFENVSSHNSESDISKQLQILIIKKIDLIMKVFFPVYKCVQKEKQKETYIKKLKDIICQHNKCIFVEKYFNLFNACDIFFKLVKSKEFQNYSQLDLFYFITNEYCFSLDQENFVQQALAEMEKRKKHPFRQQKLLEIHPINLIEIGFELQQLHLPHKALYYVQMGYQKYSYILQLAYLYGILLFEVGEFKRAKLVLENILKNYNIHSKLNIYITLAEVYIKLDQLQKAKEYLGKSQQMIQKKMYKNKNSVSTQSFHLKINSIFAQALIIAEQYESLITYIRVPSGKISARSKIYLMFAYFQLKRYKQCEQQLFQPFDSKLQRVDPLKYINYLNMFLNCQHFSFSFKQKIKEMISKAQQILKIRAQSLIGFSMQLFKKQDYKYALKLAKYVEKQLKAYSNEQRFNKIFEKIELFMLDTQGIKNLSFEKLKMLEIYSKEEDQFERYQMILAEQYMKHDRKMANKMLRYRLEKKVNYSQLHVYLDSLKLSSVQEIQDIEQWLEKLNKENQIQDFIQNNQLNIAYLLKRSQRYQSAIQYYQRQMQKESQLTDQNCQNLFECYFIVIRSFTPQKFNIKGEIKIKIFQLIKNYLNSKEQHKSFSFVFNLSKLILQDSQNCIVKEELTQSQKNKIQFLIKLATMAITFDQLTLNWKKNEFQLKKQPKLFLKNTLQIKQRRVDLKRLLLIISKYSQKQISIWYQSLISLIQSKCFLVDKKEVFFLYCEYADCRRALPVFRQLLSQSKQRKNIELEIKKQLIKLKVKDNHILTLLNAIAWQKSLKVHRKTKQILQKSILINANYELWQQCLIAKIKQFEKVEMEYLNEAFQN